MKSALPLLVMLLLCSGSSIAQVQGFPNDWAGNWKGELRWYRAGKPEPQKVNMELRIQRENGPGSWSWLIIYGSATEDNRPYQLIQKDSTGVHWVIDENNGILLDQYFIGNRLMGAFTVGQNTILNSYWMEEGQLVAEFYSMSAEPVTRTGKGTGESPKVDSYKMGSYQRAILARMK